MTRGLPLAEGFRTPDAPADCADHEVVVWELPDGDLEVRDPLVEEPYRLAEVIADPTARAFIKESWHHNAASLSVRHLTNTQEFATKHGTDRWSSMGHMISVAAMTARYGGSGQEVLAAAAHDKAKRPGAHRTDDLLAGRGKENAHDLDLPAYLRRNGFFHRLAAKGVTDSDGNIDAYDGANIAALVAHAEEDLPLSFTNQPGRTGSMEVERLQYLAQEGVIWIYEPALVREGLTHAIRATHKVHGEHIVFDDPEAARLFNTIQVRCASEHWADPMNDLIDELLMTLDRRLLLTPKNLPDRTLDMTRYYPGDVMYTTEEKWGEFYRAQAEKDPFAAAMLKIATHLAEQQRRVHDTYDHDDAYTSPAYPVWVTEQALIEQRSPHATQMITKGRGSFIVAEMQAGKPRAIDPWVVQPGGDWRRLSNIMPETKAYRERQCQWQTNDSYAAIINFNHPSLGLTPAEKRSFGPALRDMRRDWPAALQRPLMPDDLLTRRVAKAAYDARRTARPAA